jgi:murein DD-endopeptidase MepM/ murein hydrolase activator NlpD
MLYVMPALLLIGLASFLLTPASISGQAKHNNPAEDCLVRPDPDEADSAVVEVREEKPLRTVQGKVKKNETFYELMVDSGISPTVIAGMTSAARGVYDLRRIRPGKSYEMVLDGDGAVEQVQYCVDQENTFVIRRTPDGFDAEVQHNPFDIYLKRVSGAIDTTLFEAVQAIGEGPELAVKLSEIFAWDIDFNFDIRRGDRFIILFEEKWRDGRFHGYGRILAAEFMNGGEKHTALYYRTEKGKGGYFSPDGRSVEKQFLRSPLKFTRISSKFTYKRYHPILKAYRPHLGVDYVAPRGTPILAAGDGKVIFAARKGGNGKFVKIRHNGTYMSGYLHLSRFARGIRAGKKVKQGQVIGYVGSSGLATGPHLCYRFYKNGKFANPLSVKFPSAAPVPKREMANFRENGSRLLSQLLKRPPAYLVDKHDYLNAAIRHT